MRNIETHYCLKCKKKFYTRDSNKLFCSLFCEELYENPEKIEPRILYETCLGCGEPLTQDRQRGPKKKFCCDKCRWIWHNTIKKEKNYDRQGT